MLHGVIIQSYLQVFIINLKQIPLTGSPLSVVKGNQFLRKILECNVRELKLDVNVKS